MQTMQRRPAKPSLKLPKSPFEIVENEDVQREPSSEGEVNTIDVQRINSLDKRGKAVAGLQPRVSGGSASSASGAEDEPAKLATKRTKSFFSVRSKKHKDPARKDLMGPRRSSITATLSRPKQIFQRKKQQFRAAALARRVSGGHDEPTAPKQSTVFFNLEPTAQDEDALNAIKEDMATRATAFERGTYRLEDEMKDLDKEGIVRLRGQLTTANRDCGDKIKILLHQYYPAFISASRGIRAMDKELQALRGFVNREYQLLGSLKEITGSDGREQGDTEAGIRGGYIRSWADSPEGTRWQNALQVLDIAIAERHPVEALNLLKKTEKILMPSQKSGLYSHSLGTGTDLKTETQARQLVQRRNKLIELVTAIIRLTTLGSERMQVATQILGSLTGRAHALNVHLDAHTAQLRNKNQSLLKQYQAGGETDGTEFVNAFSQQVFCMIASACEDVAQAFGKDLKDLSSLVMVWALQETERCAMMLKRHALAPFAAPAGLGPTITCCTIACVHCAALKASHKLCLTPRLMRDLWSTIDQVLQRRVKRISEDVKAAVKRDIEKLEECPIRPSSKQTQTWAGLMKIFSSADVLLDELEAVFKLCQPLQGPRFREALMHAVTRLFKDFAGAIADHFKTARQTEGDLPEYLESAIEPCMEVANAMIAQFLPDMAKPLLARCGSVCNMRALNAQLKALQTVLMPPEESAQSETEESADEDSASESEQESVAELPMEFPMPTAVPKQDWRTYQETNEEDLESNADDDDDQYEYNDEEDQDHSSRSDHASGQTDLVSGNSLSAVAIENPFAKFGTSQDAQFSSLEEWKQTDARQPHQALSTQGNASDKLGSTGMLPISTAAIPSSTQSSTQATYQNTSSLQSSGARQYRDSDSDSDSGQSLSRGDTLPSRLSPNDSAEGPTTSRPAPHFQSVSNFIKTPFGDAQGNGVAIRGILSKVNGQKPDPRASIESLKQKRAVSVTFEDYSDVEREPSMDEIQPFSSKKAAVQQPVTAWRQESSQSIAEENDDDIEEMNEELSDYDEEEMMAQLMKKR